LWKRAIYGWKLAYMARRRVPGLIQLIPVATRKQDEI
jgi:hypothetical protein